MLLGQFPALAGVDFESERGEAVLLQGPNGAGKTTLLRLCAGLLRLEQGRGRVLGYDLTDDRRAVRRRVAYVGHRTMLYDDLTVRENLDFWGRAAGVEAGQIRAAADRLGIEARLTDVPVAKISAGQRRRVALAVAAARRPELWLLDEPHAGLDREGRDIVDDLIGRASDAGGTVLIASHELDRVVPVVDRTVTIAGGIVAAEAISAV